jgi:hypothetical protein
MKLIPPERVADEAMPPARPGGRSRTRRLEPQFEVVIREEARDGQERWHELVELLLEVGVGQ